jgi:serine/threonine protein kinase
VVLRQVSLALQNVHRQNILHLDIKESNILITFNKENQFLTECGNLPLEFKLADWGVSRNLSNHSHIAHKDNVVFHRGTPRYMAPEQNINKSVSDVFRVEVFSLGVVLFKLLFKTFPFTVENV